MTQTIFSLYEGNYHLGVAALVNSAIRGGFVGRVFLGYRDALPPWVDGLEPLQASEGESAYKVGEVEILFIPCNPERHLTYHKPFFALDLLERFPELDTLFYADPDVLFLAPWAYFENWVGYGVALCLDANFPFVGKEHPWRASWRELLQRTDLREVNETSAYYNAGFFGVSRADVAFLENWSKLTEEFEASGGDSQRMDTGNFLKSIRSDQELLAVAAMTHGRLSEIGQEGMGFNGHHCILSHAIESPKPWNRNFLRLACSGIHVSRASQLFFEHSRSPICAWSDSEFRFKMTTMRLSQLLTRFYKKAK